MLTTLQPNRPTLYPPHHSSAASPFHQQIRRSSAPRNQIEALPPQIQLLAQCQVEQQMVHDAASRHPVFFTARLKKAPTGVKAGPGSPVCEGYIWEEGSGKREGGKL